MYANKVSTDRADMETAERDRCTYSKQTLGLDVTARECRFRLVNLGQDALSSFVESHPFFRRCEVASAARNQARASPTLQRRQTLADDAERQIHVPSGCRKTSCCENIDESPQFVDVIKHEDLLIVSIWWRLPPPESG